MYGPPVAQGDARIRSWWRCASAQRGHWMPSSDSTVLQWRLTKQAGDLLPDALIGHVSRAVGDGGVWPCSCATSTKLTTVSLVASQHVFRKTPWTTCEVHALQ